MSRAVPVPNLAVNSMATAVNVSPSIGDVGRYQAACFPKKEKSSMTEAWKLF